ncbi:NB-ARC domain-containing protein [Acaryochloris sp. 'Moss Beach']|uniref:NB-ARC domain-containing protein n=1 Tax=Acaryochloris sp. 'Moss Beach' TaxID=2740837 RepID=UPI001F3C0F06|nr:NB-ARC domain-containing protein [Acaryochloris sp. 'Moss Beach']
MQYAISQLELKHYPGGFCWLRARDQEIATQIVSFAQTKLGLTFPDGLDEQGQVDYCWGHWREGDVLVVLDDVTEFDAVEPYLPPSDPKFKVLLTTRLNIGSSVQSLFIEELDDESALALLETLVGPERIQSQLEDAKTLCGWVGNLPLGLELLGRFLARRLDWSIEKMIERLESKKLEAQALIAKESGMTAQLGVAAALELSWVELNEAEQELACLLGMFAIAPIPWTLVEGCFDDVKPDDLEDYRDNGLHDRSLIKREGEGIYQLHQIVQEFFQAKLSARQARSEYSFLKKLATCLSELIPFNYSQSGIWGISLEWSKSDGTWDKNTMLFPHAQAIVQHAEKIELVSKPIFILYNFIADYLRERQFYGDAIAEGYLKAISIGEQLSLKSDQKKKG